MAGKYNPFGVDLDPAGELSESNLPDGDIKASIRGENVSYDTMIDELEERSNNAAKGRRIKHRKLFSGWDPPNKKDS